mmetsp:Transcript_53251/g.64153  ORF Transcript_53251/g.64153 Transcript_53251/m.64153 type:complete len:94 (+) Transcript_53251:377-658(+)
MGSLLNDVCMVSANITLQKAIIYYGTNWYFFGSYGSTLLYAPSFLLRLINFVPKSATNATNATTPIGCKNESVALLPSRTCCSTTVSAADLVL